MFSDNSLLPPAEYQWRLLSNKIGKDKSDKVRSRVEKLIPERSGGFIMDAVFPEQLTEKEIVGVNCLFRTSPKIAYDMLNYTLSDIDSGEIKKHLSWKMMDPSNYALAITGSLCLGVGLPFLIHQLRPSVKKRRELTRIYLDQLSELEMPLRHELTESIQSIKLYQGSLEEISRELGTPGKRVETNDPKTFLREDDEYWLRAKTWLLGGNAVVHYLPGSSIGTPVKFDK